MGKKPLQNPSNRRQERARELSEIQIEMEEVKITKSQLALEHAAQSKTTLSFLQEEEYLHMKSRSL